MNEDHKQELEEYFRESDQSPNWLDCPPPRPIAPDVPEMIMNWMFGVYAFLVAMAILLMIVMAVVDFARGVV